MTGSHADRHGVLFNGRLERRRPGEPVKYSPAPTQQELVRVPLLFDVLKQSGKTSAAINWPCTRGSTSIDDNFPDVPGTLAYTTKTAQRRTGAERATQAIRSGKRRRAGRDLDGGGLRNHPDADAAFLALHLNNVDAAHHRYGPKSSPGYAAAALNDSNVGRVLEPSMTRVSAATPPCLWLPTMASSLPTRRSGPTRCSVARGCSQSVRGGSYRVEYLHCRREAPRWSTSPTQRAHRKIERLSEDFSRRRRRDRVCRRAERLRTVSPAPTAR